MIPSNPPAFPTVYDNSPTTGEEGMTLRDYFAAKAMNGIYANCENKNLNANQIAEVSYIQADAMLNFRSKSQ